ncbi:MAG: gamma-glutamyl-gamma-aminobutyrate hydrolase family protein [Kouleothrix sp.]|nr:gamma-glutamyl-gamma-aminobutyrate hydrolase family protein [Kouleothrix sp.]
MSNQAQPRPLVGIILTRYARPGGSSTLAGIGEKYILSIEAAGGIPLLIYLSHDAGVLDALYRSCDALLLAGGEDVDPAHYGAAPHPQLGAIEALRDEVELALSRRAVADQKPLLGICRGIQVLNVALGGTLYQDIPAELPGALDHYASRSAPERSHLAHPVALAEDSWLAERLGAAAIDANSFHHQSVRDVAPGLRVTGRSPDGVIEAVESTGASFVVGVQCHPEELWERAEPRWARMFQGFVAAARRTPAS